MSDVAAILNAGRAERQDNEVSALSTFRSRGATFKTTEDDERKPKKKKLPRELSALIGSNQPEILPPIVPTRKVTLVGLKARPNAVRPKRWLWKAFSSSARKDGAQFYHWARADSEFPDYPFARFAKKVDVIKYTDEEYKAYLSPAPDKLNDQQDHDARWPKEHTDLLFELCRKYDLRWPVIYDRFDLKPPHSVEEMKLRFYTVTARIVTARLKIESMKPSVQAFQAAGYHTYSYKPDWEQKRRKQLDAAFKRTNEALAQERELLKELRAVQNQIRKLQARNMRTAVKSEKREGGMDVDGEGGFQVEPGVVAVPATPSQYPPIFPNAASLAISNLAMKARPPHIPGVTKPQPTEDTTAGTASAGGMGAARRALRPAASAAASAKDPFKGVALRSAQLHAPLEGYAADSKALERVNTMLKEQLHLPEKPLACAQVMIAYRQLKREAEHFLSLAAAVEAEEKQVYQLHALRRECGLKALPTGKVAWASGTAAQAVAQGRAPGGTAIPMQPAGPRPAQAATHQQQQQQRPVAPQALQVAQQPAAAPQQAAPTGVAPGRPTQAVQASAFPGVNVIPGQLTPAMPHATAPGVAVAGGPRPHIPATTATAAQQPAVVPVRPAPATAPMPVQAAPRSQTLPTAGTAPTPTAAATVTTRQVSAAAPRPTAPVAVGMSPFGAAPASQPQQAMPAPATPGAAAGANQNVAGRKRKAGETDTPTATSAKKARGE